MSLNNRISIRDTYGTQGAVDCQVATFPSSNRSETGTDVILLNTEKHQKLPLKHSLSETDIEGRVVSEPHDFILPSFLMSYADIA